MTAPEWLKPGLVGAGVGAVALAIIGFGWGGWVTSGTAEAMAVERTQVEVVQALVPFCIAQAKADPQAALVNAELAEAASYKRAEILMKAGWATMPGAEPNLSLAKACATTLAAGS
jgi:hypothetical protein